jgi:hypothetical protein
VRRKVIFIPAKEKNNMNAGYEITTIVASLDDSTVHACYARMPLEDVLGAVEAGTFLKCDTGFGEIYLAPSAVRYVQKGRQRLPVSATPGTTSQSEHRAFVSPAMG